MIYHDKNTRQGEKKAPSNHRRQSDQGSGEGEFYSCPAERESSDL